MEGQIVKHRRVYSLEPEKAAQAVFTRNYVNYLVPALMKIKEKKCLPEDEHDNVVKYEVDMAMATSAQGFAWSNALKSKLLIQRDPVGSKSQAKVLERDFGETENENENENEDDDDDVIISGQLRSLRRLVPGGEEMVCNEQMVAELESYVRCLQMQVNILQYLADQTP